MEAKINKDVIDKVLILEPESLFLYLDQQSAKEASKEERVKGYRIKVKYNAVSESEAKTKQENILKVITDSAKKNFTKKD